MSYDIEISDRDLPALSAVAMQALELVRQDDATHQRIENLIRQDPALTSRLLHIANSPFYMTRQQARSISDAARRLGLRQLQNVIVAAATGELFSAEDPVVNHMWEHAQAVAIASQTLADELGLSGVEEAYVAGLLHDVGKIIIYRQHPEPYREMIEEALQHGRPLREIEVEKFQFFDHCSVGGLVIRKWKLSEAIAESTRFHHELVRPVAAEFANPALACLVTLANLVVHMIHAAEPAMDPSRLCATHCAEKSRFNGANAARLVAAVQNRLGTGAVPTA